jgi:hypothetical protein
MVPSVLVCIFSVAGARNYVKMGMNLLSAVCRATGHKKNFISKENVPCLNVTPSRSSMQHVRSRMFLGLPYPDPSVRGTDPAQDPSIINQK